MGQLVGHYSVFKYLVLGRKRPAVVTLRIVLVPLHLHVRVVVLLKSLGCLLFINERFVVLKRRYHLFGKVSFTKRINFRRLFGGLAKELLTTALMRKRIALSVLFLCCSELVD